MFDFKMCILNAYLLLGHLEALTLKDEDYFWLCTTDQK